MPGINLPKQDADRAVTGDERRLHFDLCRSLMRHKWMLGKPWLLRIIKSNSSKRTLSYNRQMCRRVAACIERNRKDSPVVYQPLEWSDNLMLAYARLEPQIRLTRLSPTERVDSVIELC